MSSNQQLTLEAIKSVLVFITQGIGATILLLMPGYILGVVYRGLRAPQLSERAFIAITAFGGMIVHLLMLFWTVPLITRILRDGASRHVLQIAAWAFVVLIIVPIVVGSLLAQLSEIRRPRWLLQLLRITGLSAITRTADAWNWIFRQERAAYVRIQLKDGKMILGWFGDKSFASSDATLRDIYLEQLWNADQTGWFQEAQPDTAGMWIRGDEIEYVEFYEGSGEQEDASTYQNEGLADEKE
jgi:hypothetical protein